jgi:hypothetical protein
MALRGLSDPSPERSLLGAQRTKEGVDFDQLGRL